MPSRARKMLDLSGEEGVRGGLSDQGLDRGAVAGARIGLDQIRLRDASASAGDVGEAMDTERVALADKQRAAAVLGKKAGLRLNDTKLAQFPLRGWPAHDEIGEEARGTAQVEREIAEGDRAGADHLDD